MLPSREGELFGHGVAADNVASLEHGDRHTGLGEIRGAHQRVVPAAHHDNVADRVIQGGFGHFRPSVDTSHLLR